MAPASRERAHILVLLVSVPCTEKRRSRAHYGADFEARTEKERVQNGKRDRRCVPSGPSKCGEADAARCNKMASVNARGRDPRGGPSFERELARARRNRIWGFCVSYVNCVVGPHRKSAATLMVQAWKGHMPNALPSSRRVGTSEGEQAARATVGTALDTRRSSGRTDAMLLKTPVGHGGFDHHAESARRSQRRGGKQGHKHGPIARGFVSASCRCRAYDRSQSTLKRPRGILKRPCVTSRGDLRAREQRVGGAWTRTDRTSRTIDSCTSEPHFAVASACRPVHRLGWHTLR